MSMAKEALKMWLDLPADVSGKILSNVWCPDCSTAVTICDYSADLDGGVVVLRGFCGTCGHKVARVLEGCGESPKKSRKFRIICLNRMVLTSLNMPGENTARY